eukprot:TRINITY_DN27104_c0_g2_i1.p1 TRINITY_DN27104_c0_g2~~TRINITY_DN27104_c0_g2_i1.p1  ORF type:complete len:1323 (-),score=271.54 TRINITY_DN27104_c0_g2_i1:33-4001(-)
MAPKDKRASLDADAGGNAYERRLRSAVLGAAVEGRSWDEARAGLKVVCVGTFAKSEARACACGQKPLQRVFHLRHEGTGRQLDIGASCAKRFRMLGDVETQEAERALKNLEQLNQDKSSNVQADLLKLARASGLLSQAEVKLLRNRQEDCSRRASSLKAIMVVGFDFVRRTDDEIRTSLASRPVTVAERRALLRLAIYKKRHSLLDCFDFCELQESDLLLGSGNEAYRPSLSVSEPMSLIALAARLAALPLLRRLLDAPAIAWKGRHAQAALVECMRCRKPEHECFFEEYLAKPAAVTPCEIIARLAARSYENPRFLRALLLWCARHPQAKRPVLDVALKEACAAAPEQVVIELIEAGAKDEGSSALMVWCARLGGGQEKLHHKADEGDSHSEDEGNRYDVQEADLNSSGAGVAELLIHQAGSDPRRAGKQLERACLHHAAAAGDEALVRVLLMSGASPWECTSSPRREQTKCSELTRSGLHVAGNLLPLEVARASDKNTAGVEDALKERMLEDLQLARDAAHAPLNAWLTEGNNLADAFKQRLRGNFNAVSYKQVKALDNWVQRLRGEPDKVHAEVEKARQEASERRRRVEEARAEAERAKAALERQRAELEERRLRQRQEELRKQEEERRVRLEEERRHRQKERRKLLHNILEQGPQRVGFGEHADLSYEELARVHPTYVRQAADGQLDSTLDAEGNVLRFVLFARLRQPLLQEEVEHASLNLQMGKDLLDGEAEMQEEWETKRAEMQRNVAAERREERRQQATQKKAEALNTVFDLSEVKLNSGKHAGKSFERVFSSDPDYAQWWLDKGPGNNNAFGKFVAARMRLTRFDLETEQVRRDTQEQTERTSALSAVACQCGTEFASGKHAGLTWLTVMTDHRDYADWWLDRGPGAESEFGKFAAAWRRFRFSSDEVQAAQVEAEAEAELNSGPAAKRARRDEIPSSEQLQGSRLHKHPVPPAAMPPEAEVPQQYLGTDAATATASSSTTPANTGGSHQVGTQQEARARALSYVASKSGTTFPRGKYAGKTWLDIMSIHKDYAEWWLYKGPGEETDFGRFVASWRNFHFSVEEVLAAQVQRTEPESGQSCPEAALKRTRLSDVGPAGGGQVQRSCEEVPQQLFEHEARLAGTNSFDASAGSAAASSSPNCFGQLSGVVNSVEADSSSTAHLADGLQEDRSVALARVASECLTTFAKGRYASLTWLNVMLAHQDYVDWWLTKGPGSENGFGRFATSWRKFAFSAQEVQTATAVKQSISNAPTQAPTAEAQQYQAQAATEHLPQAVAQAPVPKPQQCGFEDESDDEALLAACAQVEQQLLRRGVP